MFFFGAFIFFRFNIYLIPNQFLFDGKSYIFFIIENQ